MDHDDWVLTTCVNCGSPVLEKLDEDGTPTYLPMSEVPMPMTPRELIEMLNRWAPDQSIEVTVTNRAPGLPYSSVILVQGTNAINLTAKD